MDATDRLIDSFLRGEEKLMDRIKIYESDIEMIKEIICNIDNAEGAISRIKIFLEEHGY